MQTLSICSLLTGLLLTQVATTSSPKYRNVYRHSEDFRQQAHGTPGPTDWYFGCDNTLTGLPTKVHAFDEDMVNPDGSVGANLVTNSVHVKNLHGCVRKSYNPFGINTIGVVEPVQTLSLFVKQHSDPEIASEHFRILVASRPLTTAPISHGAKFKWISGTPVPMDYVGGLGAEDVFIQNVGDGWWRVGVRYSCDNGELGLLRQIFLETSSFPDPVIPGIGMYIWGAQLVNGPHMGVYIPT